MSSAASESVLSKAMMASSSRADLKAELSRYPVKVYSRNLFVS